MEGFDDDCEVNVYLKLMNEKHEHERGIVFNVDDWGLNNHGNLDLWISDKTKDIKSFLEADCGPSQEKINESETVAIENDKKEIDNIDINISINVSETRNNLNLLNGKLECKLDNESMDGFMDWNTGKDLRKIPLEVIVNALYYLKEHLNSYYVKLIKRLKNSGLKISHRALYFDANDFELK